MMATFDELRASRDRLLKSIGRMEIWLSKAHSVLNVLDRKIMWREELSPETALLLQELNRELKRDNDEAEARNG